MIALPSIQALVTIETLCWTCTISFALPNALEDFLRLKILVQISKYQLCYETRNELHFKNYLRDLMWVLSLLYLWATQAGGIWVHRSSMKANQAVDIFFLFFIFLRHHNTHLASLSYTHRLWDPAESSSFKKVFEVFRKIKVDLITVLKGQNVSKFIDHQMDWPGFC